MQARFGESVQVRVLDLVPVSVPEQDQESVGGLDWAQVPEPESDRGGELGFQDSGVQGCKSSRSEFKYATPSR